MTLQDKLAEPSCTSEEALEIVLTLRRANFELKVDVSLPAQGISVLFGPSGSGKTSLLRCVAGLESQGLGRVVLGGSVMQDTAQGIHWPSHQRPLGYVFQEASLFEHLDVMGNLRFGLDPKRLQHKMLHRVARPPTLSAKDALDQAIEVLGR
jgi:ABC-type molybdate transport system ATPase subunit